MIMPLLKPKSQALQRAIDGYLEAAKGWNDHMALHQRSFAEYYCEGNAALVYKLELSVPPSNPDDPFCSYVQCGNTVLSAFAVLHKQVLDPAGLNIGNQQFMLVDVIELVEGIQHVTVPSLVGLYIVNDQRSNSDEERLVWSSSKKLFEASPVGIDWEILLPFGRHRLPAYFAPHIVNCRSQVVQRVSEDQADFKWKTLCHLDPHKVIERVSVTIDTNSVETTFTERLQAHVKIMDVFLGPFEF